MTPARAAHVCNYPGCNELVFSGSYCIDHQRKSEQARGNAHARGYGKKWQVKRQEFLDDHPWCIGFPAGIHGRELVPATDVDHIRRRKDGGSDDEENLQPLCHACHSRKTFDEVGRGHQKVSDLPGETVRRSDARDFPRSKP